MNLNPRDFINQWYPVIIAIVALLYSVGLGLAGYEKESLYSANWPIFILLLSVVIRQRRNP